MIRRIALFTALVASLCAASGCTTLGVKPWQRDLLAKPAMKLDAYPLDAALDEHVYFSKEASSGGRSFGGGGCGCN
ncbi:MAG: DUF4266 domain-containing protein [Gammaproteobacteria bacterium]